jgi:hypothetical protein
MMKIVSLPFDVYKGSWLYNLLVLFIYFLKIRIWNFDAKFNFFHNVSSTVRVEFIILIEFKFHETCVKWLK